MSFETELVSAILAHGPLAAAIGDRLFPDAIAERADYPAISYRRDSTTRYYTHDGTGNVRYANVVFTVWSKTVLDASTVAELLGDAIAGFNLSMESPAVSFPNFVVNQYQSNEDKSSPRIYREIVEARIFFAV